MAIHGYLRSAWLSHRALHVFIFKGIFRLKRGNRVRGNSPSCDPWRHGDFSEQTKLTQAAKEQKHAVPPEFLLFFCYAQFQ